MDNNVINNRYFQRETSGIVKLVNGINVFSLDLDGEWVPNQYLYGMFYDGTVDYEEISEETVQAIIIDRKKHI